MMDKGDKYICTPTYKSDVYVCTPAHKSSNKKIAQFEKVSFEQFKKDMLDTFDCYDDEAIRKIYEKIELPKRSTAGSAGYDFYSPIPFVLNPGCSIKIPTGIRCNIDTGYYLEIVPRSSLGFKYKMRLFNTVGIIDEDYYYGNNEGHIMVKVSNELKPETKWEKFKGLFSNKYKPSLTMTVNMNDRFCQGILKEYYITYDDNATGERTGGIGSTGE